MPDDLPDDLLVLVDKLVAASLRAELPGQAVERQVSGLTAADYVRLVNEAALLALSPDPDRRTLAYEIATHSLAISKGNPAFIKAIEFLLARLGNFPGRELLRLRYRVALAEPIAQAPALTFEAFGHERENTIRSPSGQSLMLTDFQLDLFDTLNNTAAVSVSAPTSAGKSFILALQIVRRFSSNSDATIIYVVPTRALIHEVLLRLRRALQDAGLTDVALRSVPQQVNTAGGTVYVLTQERLLTLLQVADSDFRVDVVFVDEAQGLRDGSRGVLLQAAVENIFRRFPSAECVFASPLIKNPRYMLDLFSKQGTTAHETHSPVAQSFIIAKPSGENNNYAEFSVIRRGQIIPLSRRTLDVDFRNMHFLQRRAFLAWAVTGERDGCLVYANGAWEAEETASALAKLRPTHTAPREVEEFISYIRENVHPEYGLVEPLKAGVGFHHGEMPASVRTGVEDLFRMRKLQFVCCTGTLLQGVNLPARHLIVERPRRGNGQPMGAADFLNLAGRAGRLQKEFHGNVWCLRPDYWPKAPRDRAELPDVVSALETVMRDGGKAVQRVLNGEVGADPDGAATAAIGHLLAEYVHGKRPWDFSTPPEAKEDLEATMAALGNIPVNLPLDVLKRNSGILPTRLENLRRALLEEPTLDGLLPLSPFQIGFYPRLRSIFAIVHRELHVTNSLQYKFDAWLASRWIHQDTLQQIIESSVKWRVVHGLPSEVQITIRKTVRRIENWIRYRWVRSLRAYHDVLGVVLRLQNRNQDADSLSPIYYYLEYGAFDRAILSLISLGFSRTAALMLKRLVTFPADATPEICRNILVRRDLSAANVPKIIQREARALLGTRPSAVRSGI
jgi:superfamily II DNA/RNA helicase